MSSLECGLDRVFFGYNFETENYHSLWPIHPPPFQGESFESWSARQSYANVFSPSSFMAKCLGEHPHRGDFDHLDETSKLFRLVADSVGFELASQMTFASLKTRLELRGKKGTGYWITPRDSGKYCPICFSEDLTPYFRLVWRLTFVPICLKHRVLLKSRCDSCQAPIMLRAFNPHYNLNRCYRCGNVLATASTSRVIGQEQCDVFSNLLTLAQGKSLTGFGWKYSIGEFFRALRFITTLLRRTQGEPYGYSLIREGEDALWAVFKAWWLLENQNALSY